MKERCQNCDEILSYEEVYAGHDVSDQTWVRTIAWCPCGQHKKPSIKTKVSLDEAIRIAQRLTKEVEK